VIMHRRTVLNIEYLIGFLHDNRGMTSDEIPDWLLDLNHGMVDHSVFRNPKRLDETGVIGILDVSLKSLFTSLLIEDHNYIIDKIEISIHEFEAMRDDYIYKVRQRLEIICDLVRTPQPKIDVAPFRVFEDEETYLNFVHPLGCSREINGVDPECIADLTYNSELLPN